MIHSLIIWLVREIKRGNIFLTEIAKYIVRLWFRQTSYKKRNLDLDWILDFMKLLIILLCSNIVIIFHSPLSVGNTYYTYWNIYSKMILCLEYAFKNYTSLLLTNHCKLGGLEQQKFIVFTILDDRNPKLGYFQHWFLLRFMKENLFHPSIFWKPRAFLACRWHSPRLFILSSLCISVSVFKFPLY